MIVFWVKKVEPHFGAGSNACCVVSVRVRREEDSLDVELSHCFEEPCENVLGPTFALVLEPDSNNLKVPADV